MSNFEVAYSCFLKSQEDPRYDKLDPNSFNTRISHYNRASQGDIKTFQEVHTYPYRIAFLIGFPRSGTTLLDTLLRSHPQIDVMEEKPLIGNIESTIPSKYKSSLSEVFSLDIGVISELRAQYHSLLRYHAADIEKNLIIDKLPLHTVSLPLIHALFPEAKIIFAHRHPYDTVLSCFQQAFRPNAAMLNLTSIELASNFYDRVMQAWTIHKQRLPIHYYQSKYEDLVENHELQTERILSFLELEWSDEVKNYRSTAQERGRINTPSFSQVVQPIYRTSVHKWKNYEKHFENSMPILGKWIEYFGYEYQ